MDETEILRRQKLHMSYVGDVILTRSLVPQSAPIVSFKERKTDNIYRVFKSATHNISKEEQLDYDESTPKMRVWYAGPTTRAVRRTFSDAGFLQTRKEDNDWNVCWGSPKGLEFYQTLAPGQICNQIPGSNSMGRKDTLATFIHDAQERIPDLYDEIIPKTFLIPQQIKLLKEDQQELIEERDREPSEEAEEEEEQEEIENGLKAFANILKKKKAPGGMYIYKPALGARGNGIQILSPEDQLPSVTTAAVVQRYIMNPLLVNGFKFDCRIYVLITSIEPFIFYVYQQGLGRFATEPFVPPNNENKSHTQMHLTNFSVNCKSENFHDGSSAVTKATDGDDEQIVILGNDLPSKWRLTELLEYLDEHRELFNSKPRDSIVNVVSSNHGALAEEMTNRIHNLVKLTLVSVEPRMYSFSDKANSLHAYPRRNFGLYGFDVMFTDIGKPYLIEVNSSPATGTSTQLDVGIKFPLLSDVMHLVGINCNLNDADEIIYPTRYESADAGNIAAIRGTQQLGINQFTLAPGEPRYSMTLEDLMDDEGQYVPIDYRKLTRFEKRAILQILDEQNRLGGFVRLSPDVNEEYGELFKERRYLNDLASACLKQDVQFIDLI